MSEMSPLHTEALNRARQLIAHNFGNFSDLPEDVRNTLANTYYQFCHMQMELESDFPMPDTVALAGDFMKGLDKYWRDRSHLEAAVKYIPDFITGIRSARQSGNHAEYETDVRLFLDAFKYKIPDFQKKSALRLKIERPFYAAKVKEIQNLWKLIQV